MSGIVQFGIVLLLISFINDAVQAFNEPCNPGLYRNENVFGCVECPTSLVYCGNETLEDAARCRKACGNFKVLLNLTTTHSSVPPSSSQTLPAISENSKVVKVDKDEKSGLSVVTIAMMCGFASLVVLVVLSILLLRSWHRLRNSPTCSSNSQYAVVSGNADDGGNDDTTTTGETTSMDAVSKTSIMSSAEFSKLPVTTL